LWYALVFTNTSSSEATSIKDNTLVFLVFKAGIKESFRTHKVAVYARYVLSLAIEAVASTNSTSLWKRKDTVFSINSLSHMPSLSLFVLYAIVADAFVVARRWCLSGGGTSDWSGAGNWSGWVLTDLLAAVISKWSRYSSLPFVTDDLVALFWVTLTDELFAALVLGLDDRVFIELTTFWLWALDVGALLWNADILMATVINLVRHELFIESALWNLWAVSVETLDVSTLATRTDSAYVVIIVPRFLEDTWALVPVDACWWLWGGRSNWAGSIWAEGGGADADIAWAAFTWISPYITIWTEDGFIINLWTYLILVITYASVSRALTWILVYSSNEFLIHTARWCRWALWWTILTDTDAVGNLVATFLVINMFPNWSMVAWASLWEALGWADIWCTFALALFVTSADFTVFGWMRPALTNVDVVSVWSEAASLGNVYGNWDGLSSGGSSAAISVSTAGWAGGWVVSSKGNLTGFAIYDKTKSMNKIITLWLVALTFLGGAALVGSAEYVVVRFPWLATWVGSGGALSLATVFNGAYGLTILAAAWVALGIVFVPLLAFSSGITLLVEASLNAGGIKLIKDTSLCLAAAAVWNFSDDGLVTYLVAGIVNGWAIATDAFTFFFIAYNSFTVILSNEVVSNSFKWGDYYMVVAATSWDKWSNDWTVWILWLIRYTLSILLSAAFVLAEISVSLAVFTTVITRVHLDKLLAFAAGDWKWLKADPENELIVTVILSFTDSEIGMTFVLGTTVTSVPDLVDRFLHALPFTIWASSDLTAITDKGWT
jgi:hypothetical protein